MGTPEFAVASLKKLVEDQQMVCGVFTQPDKPKNRGMKLLPTPVKEYALAHNIPVYQPERVSDPQAIQELQTLQPDLIVVAAYGQLLTQEILDIPAYGCINVHSSLLPKYRGAAPINWAILNGEHVTGVSIMYMAPTLDSGDVICTRSTEINPEENALELTERLAALGAETLAEAVTALKQGTAQRIVQDEAQVSIAVKLSKELSPIHWDDASDKIHNQIRGLIPWPCASVQLQGKRFKIYRGHLGRNVREKAGTVLSAGKDGIEVACGDGKSIFLTELQEEGGKRMAAADYLRGHPMQV